jgi:hypothetical protein
VRAGIVPVRRRCGARDRRSRERQYEAEDIAGHRWTFSETLRDVHPDEWGGTLLVPE